MKNILYLIIVLSFCGCCDPFGIKKEKFNLQKNNIQSNNLKLDGYYYDINAFDQSKNDYMIDVHIIYRNGLITSYGGGSYLNKLNELDLKLQDQDFIDKIKNNKYYWGLVEIKSNNIKFEKYYPNSPWQLYTKEGTILNDSTFQITKFYKINCGKKSEEKDINQIYHFHKFSPKPDSTNNFL